MVETEPQVGLTRSEQAEVEERAAPRTPVLYEVVRRGGEEELRRPAASLFWSGVAGGITIMASVIAEAALHRKLPDGAPWREAVADLGYSLGFLMVILGRMQLFTEQTITAVLPFMAEPTLAALRRTARLWGIVLMANLVGAAAAAAMNVHLGLMGAPLLGSMLEISATLLERSPGQVLLQGIPAGFLIASVAWIRAGMIGDGIAIVVVLTYAIALGDFAHVIAGSAEAFLLVFEGRISLDGAFLRVVLPSLVGNVIGGTGLFALLAHAQVRQEM
jgi:formate/nitrite transporter FocA (FNT family)